MKQKLLIALALAREPNLLIMDEPSANLDPQARAIFFNLLSKLPEKTTMLLTSHRVDELAGIVTRVIELDGGKIAIDDIVESHDKKILTEQQDCLITFRRIPDSVKVILRQWHFSPCDPEEFKWGGDISSADSFRFYATLTRWSGMIQEISLKTKDKV
jgi:ABC-2 type transport system ATP-binding protein